MSNNTIPSTWYINSILEYLNKIPEDYKKNDFDKGPIEKIFSDYLVQFNKQWENESNRAKWREVITNYATDKNILISLKMFNHKFKNPYKIITNEDEIIGT